MVTVTSRHITSDSLFTLSCNMYVFFRALFNDAVKLYGVVILSTGHEMIPDTYAQDLVVDGELLLPMPNAQTQCNVSLQATRNAVQSVYSSQTVRRSHQQQSSCPALKSSVPRTAPDTLIMPPSPPTVRITSCPVVCRWMNMER